MERDDIRERAYRAFIEKARREPAPDDESAVIAAQDALSEAFGLEGYPVPQRGRPRTKAETAAQTERHFSSREGAL